MSAENTKMPQALYAVTRQPYIASSNGNGFLSRIGKSSSSLTHFLSDSLKKSAPVAIHTPTLYQAKGKESRGNKGKCQSGISPTLPFCIFATVLISIPFQIF